MNNYGKVLQYFSVLFLSLLLFVIAISPFGFGYDIECWTRWSSYIFEHGFSNVYNSDTNYLPVYLYVLWAYSSVSGSIQDIVNNAYQLKLFSGFIDVVGLWLVYLWAEKKYSFSTIFLFAFLNAAFFYNTFIWGQVDGILATLAFASLYFGYNKKPILSCVFMIVLLNFKLQGIVFVPLWVVLFICNMYETKKIKPTLLAILVGLIVQILILLPFLLNNSTDKVWAVLTGYVDTFPVISANARNFWSLIFPESFAIFSEDDSSIWFYGFTYKQIGYFLFFLTSGLALIIFSLPILKRIAAKSSSIFPDKISLMLAASIVSLCFFYFNTQIHERYSHPTFIFILAYTLLQKDFIPILLFSVANFLGHEKPLKAFKFENYETFIFDGHVISVFFLATLLYLFFVLIKQTKMLMNVNANTNIYSDKSINIVSV